MTDPDGPILLVIDDDDDVRDVLTVALEDAGYRVVAAANGQLALDKIAAGLRPQLILLDLMMPVMNGWQFWDRHQAHAALRDIPLVVLTASGLTTGALGPVTVLPKPVDFEVLLQTLHRFARASRA